MNNRLKNSVEAIIHGLVFFIFFLPNFYIYEWGHIYSNTNNKANINFFKSINKIKIIDNFVDNSLSDEDYKSFLNKIFISIICIVIFSVLLSILQLLMNRNWLVIVSLPIIELVLLIYFSYHLENIWGSDGFNNQYLHSGTWFYVEVFLLIILFFYSFICYRKVSINGDVIKERSTKAISVADEIKKFKELCDNGIITDEEFQTKKEELLNR